MTTDFINQKDYLDWLEESQPESIYQGFRSSNFSSQGRGWGQTPNMMKYFQNRFSDIHNQYLWRLGSMMGQEGGIPEGYNFGQYLSQNPFAQQFAALSPFTAGRQVGRYAPFAQWA